MKNKIFFKKISVVSLSLLPLPLLANGFVEQLGQTAVFDYSKTFVSASQLPIKYSTVIRTKHTTNSFMAQAVTKNGKIFNYQMRKKDIKLLGNSAKKMSGSFNGIRVGNEDKNLKNDVLKNTIKRIVTRSVVRSNPPIHIANTTSFPWSAIGYIGTNCTGTLIGPRHVLTAGHCVYNTSNNQWYSDLSFSPARNGIYDMPYGTKSWAKVIAPSKWTIDHDSNYDYAMIVLNEPVGNQTGWLGYGYNNNLPNYTINIAGYPNDMSMDVATMWYSSCPIEASNTFKLYYLCNAHLGNGGNGSAVYTYSPATGKRTIYGIHTGVGNSANILNSATRITKNIFENLEAWKKQNP
jgi:glutamyl endopeptidase